MRLYVCMVLGGSICTLLYIFINRILPYELSLKYKNLFLKINTIFYLLPVPWIAAEIKGILKLLLEKAGVVFPISTRGDIIHPNLIWESVIIRNEKNEIVYITGYQKWFPVILIGFTIFCILLSGWIIAYLVAGYKCKKGITYIDAGKYLRDSRDKKRKIQIGVSPYIDSPVSVGIMKPIILLPLDNEKYFVSEKGIVRHELHHIINMDGLFRILTFMVIAMEWYNPLAYYLFRENIAVNEMLCDEAAVEDMTKEEKIDYMRCIIMAAENHQNVKTVITSLGATKGLSKERMKRIMGKNEKKMWKKGLAAGIMTLCFLFSSVPALAYKEPLEFKEEEYSDDVVEQWARTTMIIAVREGSTDGDYLINTEMNNLIKTADFSQGNYVLIDEAGEIFSGRDVALNNGNQTQAVCSHNYETTTILKHYKNDDGSCTVIEYNAQKCSKCEDVKLGSEISKHTYNVCPHK